MKKKLLLFPLVAGLTCLALSSYKNGAAYSAGADCTGYSGGATCAQCHNPTSSSSTTATFSMIDKVTALPVTNGMYTPGKVYTVTLKGVNTGTLSGFGFQAEPVTSSGTSAGTLTAGTYQRISTVSGRNIIEQSTRITSTPSNLATSFDWTAPVAGTGVVTFYGVINATNGNNSSGDAPSPYVTMALAENTAGIESINNAATFMIYPNPTTDNINLKMEGVPAGNYTANVFNLSGELVALSSFTVSNTNNTKQINTSSLPTGLYQLVIASNGCNKVISFVKN